MRYKEILDKHGNIVAQQPHGGPLETGAKFAFAVALIAMFGGWIAELIPNETLSVHPKVAKRLLEQASTIRWEYMRGPQTPETAGDARKKLLLIRETFPKASESERNEVQRMLSAVVKNIQDHEQRLLQQQDRAPEERVRASSFSWRVRNELGVIVYPPGHGPIADTDTVGWIGWRLWDIFLLYALFMPFAFLIFLARMVAFNYSIREQIVLGWGNILNSVLFWPAGLSEYPRSTARSMRRSMLEAEFRARKGYAWREEFTYADLRLLNELTEAPLNELRARFEAIGEVPRWMLVRARVACYMAALIGFLIAPLRARADKITPIIEPPTATATQQATSSSYKLEGFVQMQGGQGPDGQNVFAARRAWVIGSADLAGVVKPYAKVDLANQAIVEAAVIIQPKGWPVSIRFGEIASRMVYMLPRPDQLILIDVAGAAANMTFRDLGIEVAGDHGFTSWSASLLAGAPNAITDNNDDKDVQVSWSLHPWGKAFRLDFAFQNGQQPQGSRTTLAGHIAVERNGFRFDGLTTYQRLGSSRSFATSLILAYRLHSHLEVATGYDEMRLAGTGPPEHVGRAQITSFMLNDRIRIGAMYRGSSIMGHGFLGQLQAGF